MLSCGISGKLSYITSSCHVGGGLKHGSIVQIDDQAQHFKVSLVVSHQVRLHESPYASAIKMELSQLHPHMLI